MPWPLFAWASNRTPAGVCSSAALRRQYQQTLLAAGVPLYWYEGRAAGAIRPFAAVQMLAVEGIWPGYADHLRFDPDALARRAPPSACEPWACPPESRRPRPHNARGFGAPDGPAFVKDNPMAYNLRESRLSSVGRASDL